MSYHINGIVLFRFSFRIILTLKWRRRNTIKELLTKTFDFSIRIIELSNYLEEEKKQFPLILRLLECGSGIGINLRISKDYSKYRTECAEKAYKLSLETEYLLELLIKTGYLHERQGVHLLKDCHLIKEEIEQSINKKVK